MSHSKNFDKSRSRLTDDVVASRVCPPGKKDALFFDTLLPGFGVRVTASGKRMFLFQYRASKITRRVVIGRMGEAGLTTAQARKKAEALRGATREGRDPVAERGAERARLASAEAEVKARKARDAYTVRFLLEQWTADHLADRSAAYRLEAPRRLRAALADLLDTPASYMTHGNAVEALDKVKARAGPVQANRVRAYARSAFGWAVQRGSLSVNPFANAPRPARERSRERALTDAELGEVWRAAGVLNEGLRKDHAEQAHFWTALVRLLLLTGQRRGEVAGMRWSELRLTPPVEAVWSLPGARTKNNREHEVPLASPAVNILLSLPRMERCDFVLSGGRLNPPTGFGKMKARLDAAIASARAEVTESGAEIAHMPDFTLHDLRRSTATGLQRLGVRLEVTEALLNHVSGSRSGIVGVYQRHRWTEEARAAADAWAAHILGCAEATLAGRVVTDLALRPVTRKRSAG